MPLIRYSPPAVTRAPRLLALAALALLGALLLPGATAAQNWNETGDAGPLPATAQTTVGVGPLASINGNLATPEDVDMYCIRITDPLAFVARLQCVIIQGPHIWLFDATGKGVAMASLCQAGSKIVSGAFTGGAGVYYLAVSFDGLWPLSGTLGIWNPGYTLERAPDGPGAAGAITTWSGTGVVGPLNPYQILINGGATFCDAATPALAGTWGRLKQIYR